MSNPVSPTPSIGIDLGTTNSSVAIIRNGELCLIPVQPESADSVTMMPTAFAIDDKGQSLVGSAAMHQAITNPQSVVTNVKRLISQQTQDRFSYELEHPDEEVAEKLDPMLLTLQQKTLSLEEIITNLLQALADHSTAFLGHQVEQAVLTIPAYFTETQRAPVRNAAEAAGLKILRIINEPTAAAIAHGQRGQHNRSRRIAIFDLGGGTFDVSVIHIEAETFTVLATGGDIFLGGLDFDDRIVNHIMADFLDKSGFDLAMDATAVARIRAAAEAAKIDLSHQEETRVEIPFVYQEDDEDFHIELTISRPELEALTIDLVERSVERFKNLLEQAAIPIRSIDEVLLVGGQSRMPLVKDKVSEMGIPTPTTTIEPEQAVVMGAAMMAEALQGNPSSNQIKLNDLLPLGIHLIRPDGKPYCLFPENTPLPNQRQITLRAPDDPDNKLLLRLVQGLTHEIQHGLNKSSPIGQYLIANPASSKKIRSERSKRIAKLRADGALALDSLPQTKVRVSFALDAEGRLSITATDKLTELRLQTRARPWVIANQQHLDHSSQQETVATQEAMAAQAPAGARKTTGNQQATETENTAEQNPTTEAQHAGIPARDEKQPEPIEKSKLTENQGLEKSAVDDSTPSIEKVLAASETADSPSFFAEAETEIFSRDSVLEALANSELSTAVQKNNAEKEIKDPSIPKPSEVDSETVRLESADDSTKLIRKKNRPESGDQELQEPLSPAPYHQIAGEKSGSDEEDFFSFLNEKESSIWLSEEPSLAQKPLSFWARLWRWLTGNP